MNKVKLKALIILHGETGAILAKEIGISPQRFSAKLNETNGAEFTQSEIAKIKVRYKLSAEQMEEIFFS